MTPTQQLTRVGYLGKADCWAIPSFTTEGVVYRVIKVGASWHCDCLSRGMCRHIDLAQKWEAE